MRPDDGTGWPLTTDEDGVTHALECSPSRSSMYWRACDGVDVERERVGWGTADEVDCEGCLAARDVA